MPKTSSKSRQKFMLRELAAHEFPSIYPLIRLHNGSFTKAKFTAYLKEMIPLGYRVLGAYDGDKLVAVSGFWIRTRFWCGKQCDIDNFIVHPDVRGGGLGAKMMAWLDQTAVAEGCKLCVLDVYAHNNKASRFYHRAGFVITGYHFTKIPGTLEPYQPVRR